MFVMVQDEDHGKRLDHLLQERMPEYSRTRIQSWFRVGRVRIARSRVKPSHKVRAGETYEVDPALSPELSAEPEDLPIEILYEDDAVLAVNKPAGLTVHAGAGVHSGTLVNRLVHHFQTLSQVGGELRPGIVHRIDKDTSGVLLVARSDTAHRNLAAQFAARTVEKVYIAVVKGSLRADSGRIVKPIARDPHHRTRMTARLASGRPALTEYRVIERFAGFTLAEVRIGTGRTHQIRVHMADLGHPVAGDKTYGGAMLGTPDAPGAPRMFLHAARIGFVSPATDQRVMVEAPLPEELQEWLRDLHASN